MTRLALWSEFQAPKSERDKRGEEEEEREAERYESIRKHAHLIRHLRRHYRGTSRQLMKDIMRVFLEHCRLLLSFEATCVSDEDWGRCKQLVGRNPGLRQVGLRSDMTPPDMGRDIIDLACHHPLRLAGMASLRRLELGCTITLVPLAWLAEACPALEDLIVGSIIAGSMEFPKDMPPMNHLDYVDRINGGDQKDENQEEDYKLYTGTAHPSQHHTQDLPWGLQRRLGLKKFHLEGECGEKELGTFLKLCPLLETLILDDMPTYVRDAVCQVIRDGHLPNLASLGLGSGEEDPELHWRVIQALPPHTIKNLHFQDMTAQDVNMLIERQYSSLVDIHIDLAYDHIHDIYNEDGDDGFVGFENLDNDYEFGEAVCNILASCPRLCELTITTKSNMAIDIRHLIAKPWVCNEMHALELPVTLQHMTQDHRLFRHAVAEKHQAAAEAEAEAKAATPPPSPSSPPSGENYQYRPSVPLEEWEKCQVVWMKRLGQLDRLRLLNLDSYNSTRDVDFEMAMTWTLNLGLKHLKNLTSLEDLILPKGPYFQGLPEWKFMKQHWPKLRSFVAETCILNEFISWCEEHWPELKVGDDLLC
ncbi:hypothetical protein DFQ27_008025 [Actinomortierella ambigua]|uniref:Uncharacterized protein n=1 Tax=Actinomortierella ambigua TaxID=1343610 RepID=A0A9P6PUW3_9FUNG|nr:hypothetical protein DFQ27_008025 [Actinomortierella ambigua]